MTNTLSHLRKIALIACYCVVFCAFGLFFAVPAQAQFIGYTSPQTVTQTFGSSIACTGSAQIFTAANLGQSVHTATIVPSATGAILMEIDGLDAQGNSFRISDIAAPFGQTVGPNLNSGSVTAYGYFPQTQVKVTCPAASGTFALSYAGTSQTNPSPVGTYQFTQLVKELWNVQSLTPGPTTPLIQTPFGSTQGFINLKFSGGAALAMTLNCTSPSFGNNTTFVYNFTAQNLAGIVQTFAIPATPCPLVSVTAPSLATQTISLEYIFTQPGFASPPGYFYVHGGNTTATVVKSGSGFLHTVNVNSGNAAASTLTFFDLAPTACTGTPATNTVATIQVPASINALPTFTYDIAFLTGICVKASQTMDFTVSAQ